mgnify:CR=1 FL=1
MPSPTQLTLKALRSLGWHAQVVERYIAPIKIRKDLFGFIDILSFDGFEARLPSPNSRGVLGVQACRGKHVEDRWRKAKDLMEFADWISSPYRRFQIWGWRKMGARGKRKTWKGRIREWSKSDGLTEREYVKRMIL